MNGLIRKDLLVIKNQLLNVKYMGIFLGGSIFSFLLLKSDFYLIMIFLLFILLNSLSKLFSEDQYSGWLRFIRVTSSLSTKEVVLARMISAVIFALMINVIFSLLLTAGVLLSGNRILSDTIGIAMATLIISLMYVLLATPFQYLFLENGVFIMLIVVGIIGGLLVKFTSAVAFVQHLFMSGSYPMITLVGVLSLLVVFMVSFLFSFLVLRYRSSINERNSK
ncbi:MAG: ABC-2 transporter permease [Aerococcus sp.]|nr:ABC-2 transporter permease [Aerococcus sp.]